jgi:hypothetical protein
MSLLCAGSLTRCAAICLLMLGTAHAQTQTRAGVPGRGNGSYGVSLQHITITKRDLDVVYQTFGEVTLRSAFFDFDYGLTDRLALNVTLPFKSNRYIGEMPHDPRLLLDDHGEEFLDDGRYHSAWGDFGVNLRWLWRSSPIVVTPFFGFYFPSNDYPLFTETQAGTQQWRADFGVNLAGPLGPPRLNLAWQAGYAYSLKEKTKPSDAPARRVDNSRISAEFLWRATPLITPYLSLSHVEPHNALDFPWDFVGIPYSDQYYYHDQLLPWAYTTWSAGVSYQASAKLNLSASYGRSLRVEFGHFYEPAIAINIFRGFVHGN